MHWTHILGSFGGMLGVMPFFNNAPLAVFVGHQVDSNS